MKDHIDTNEARKRWMGVLAKAPAGRVTALFKTVEARPQAVWLRPPEIGTAMVRARAGATGAPFNLGEMTVTRCALRLPCGTVGHAYIQGRNKTDAEAAALVDAMMQTDRAGEIEAAVLTPLRAEAQTKRSTRAAKAAATKVDFFTLVRGED